MRPPGATGLNVPSPVTLRALPLGSEFVRLTVL